MDVCLPSPHITFVGTKLLLQLHSKVHTPLGYVVSLILLSSGHVFRFRIVSRDGTRVPSSRGLVKQYNQELCNLRLQDVSLKGFSREH